MKTLKLIALAAFALLFSECKTSSPTAPSGPAPSLLEVAQILDSTQAKFLAFSEQNNGNPHLSIMQTASWVQSQPNVASAMALDSVYITIILKSGLRTTFAFDETDSSGASLFKGGGGSGSSKEPVLSSSNVLSTNTITNKKVLIYCAAFTDFYFFNEIQSTVDILNKSTAGLDVTILRDEECTWQKVDNFKDYGLVIIDTHGLQDAFMIGTKIHIDNNTVSDELFKASIVAKGGQAMLDKLLSGELSFLDRVKGNILQQYWKQAVKKNDYNLYLFLTSKYIDALPPMPGTVIMGSMCYSGWDLPLANGYTPIKKSFTNKVLISYYYYGFDNGKSDKIGSLFAKRMEDALANSLAHDFDSTGIAHLKDKSKNVEYTDPYNHDQPFKHFGADDYSYQQPCGDTITDARDGQKYATVCIGLQTWMAQNLNYNVPGSACYDDDGLNCNIFGRLYDWKMVMSGAAATDANPSKVQGICPKGWHVPSTSEWFQLASYADKAAAGNNGGDALRDSMLWQNTQYRGSDAFGFKGLPGGKYIAQPGIYRGIYMQGYWWTSERH
jgi:uncharacterized protein (TIGR02145 family)